MKPKPEEKRGDVTEVVAGPVEREVDPFQKEVDDLFAISEESLEMAIKVSEDTLIKRRLSRDDCNNRRKKLEETMMGFPKPAGPEVSPEEQAEISAQMKELGVDLKILPEVDPWVLLNPSLERLKAQAQYELAKSVFVIEQRFLDEWSAEVNREIDVLERMRDMFRRKLDEARKKWVGNQSESRTSPQ